MFEWLQQSVPPTGIGLVLTLFLSMMIGLEFEERKERRGALFFGGIRTYPLISLTGFLLIVVAPQNYLPFTAGLLVLGGLLAIVYWTKVGRESLGFTTEMTALATFVLGGVVGMGLYWLAVAVSVSVVLLVHMKQWLEDLALKISGAEVATFAKFLIITAVILPVLPKQEFTRFKLNLNHAWMVVVAVSAVSYGSYLLQRKFRDRGSMLLSATLGGLYSSTVTTVVLSKKSKTRPNPRGFAGGILLASGMMYLRITVLLLLFSRALFDALLGPFLTLAAIASLGGAAWTWWCMKQGGSDLEGGVEQSKNPLDFSTAFVFAGLFLLILVATKVVLQQFGGAGLYWLAAIMGMSDVDPFIMGLTATAGQNVDVRTAAVAIVVATGCNNLAKGVYSAIFGSRRTGRLALAFLVTLSILSAVVIWLWP